MQQPPFPRKKNLVSTPACVEDRKFNPLSNFFCLIIYPFLMIFLLLQIMKYVVLI